MCRPLNSKFDVNLDVAPHVALFATHGTTTLNSKGCLVSGMFALTMESIILDMSVCKLRRFTSSTPVPTSHYLNFYVALFAIPNRSHNPYAQWKAHNQDVEAHNHQRT